MNAPRTRRDVLTRLPLAATLLSGVELAKRLSELVLVMQGWATSDRQPGRS